VGGKTLGFLSLGHQKVPVVSIRRAKVWIVGWTILERLKIYRRHVGRYRVPYRSQI